MSSLIKPVNDDDEKTHHTLTPESMASTNPESNNATANSNINNPKNAILGDTTVAARLAQETHIGMKFGSL